MKLVRIFLSALTVLLIVPGLRAQQTGLSGTVTDASGALLADASVKVHQVGAETFSTKTTAAGTWQLPSLTAGDYIVTITGAGFATVETRITMLIGQMPNLDTKLPLKGASDSVVVEANATVIETTSSTVAGNISPSDVRDMPINGRNYMELATLVAGVRVNAITNDTPLGNNNSGKFQINLDGLQVTQDTADP